MPKIEADGEALIADLSHIYSIDLEFLHGLTDAQKVSRYVSLSKDAYFLLLIKMAWFFLRPSVDTERDSLEAITAST